METKPTVNWVRVTIVTGIALIAAGVFYWIGSAYGTEQTSTSSTTASTKSTTTTSETASWKTYTNSKYGFTLTFDDNWKNYKVYDWNKENTESPAPAADSYSFCVPTSSKTWKDKIAGYACPITINAYQSTVLDNLVKAGEPISAGDILGEKNGMKFVFSTWQDSPSDLVGKIDTKKIKDTFQLAK